MNMNNQAEKRILLLLLVLLVSPWIVGAETGVRSTLELYTSAFRGQNNTWYFTGTGKADLRFESLGNSNMRAQAALEFYPFDVTGAPMGISVPAVQLDRFWIKAKFPGWRLTAGKTKLAWGNGSIFNSGDILFGSLNPFVDFTESSQRDDTSWLTAVNIPTGRFSFLEAVVLPPNLVWDGTSLTIPQAQGTSGGLRYFFRAGSWKLETGYLYKGDAKVTGDLLGHRPYFSFHGHAGVDLYGAVSMAAGWDSSANVNRQTWEQVASTVNLSIGAFHQFQVGYDSTLTLRLETLLMPWQSWTALRFNEVLEGGGYYGMMIYPEITWNLRSTWFASIQSLISPVDASAQITGTVGWYVFQGFTLLGFVTVNAGEESDLFAFDRSGDWPAPGGNSWPASTVNGMAVTFGARYSY